MKVKYVILDDCIPVLFSAATQHSAAGALGTPTSAGFCSFHFDDGWKVDTWGESISLKLKAGPNDACFIERLLSS